MRAPVFRLVVVAVIGAAACTPGRPETGVRRHVVEISGFAFVPESLTAAEGDTIVWINRDAVPHTAAASDGSWDSGSIPSGGTWTHVVGGADSGSYLCTFHPTMRGRIATP